MSDDILNYVKTCVECQTKKAELLPKAGLLQPIEVGGPFEMIEIDILGPFTKTDYSNKYIVVATDYLTKWVEAKAYPDATAWKTSKFIIESLSSRGSE